MNSLTKYMTLGLCLLSTGFLTGQEAPDSEAYKKRVLESTEIDFLSSYYRQDGKNAAVTGGIGTEELTDGTGTIIVSVPLNEDAVLTVDVGISAYTSASSSNVDPFDNGSADPFQASTGASSADVWSGAVITYSHSSDDRNRIWSASLSVATEYDYFSVGAGGSYTWLFNEKNTEFTLKGNAYFDQWNTIYPIELRPFSTGGNGLNSPLFRIYALTGNPDYNPGFVPFSEVGRNSYSLGVGFSQILGQKFQASLALDAVQQDGLLSTPFQRVYFQDVEDSYLDGFHLADDVERLPDSRLKIALGTRLHYYVNEYLTLRTFYRYYLDSWDIRSHTASLEAPVKISRSFTIYPSYRYYWQTAAADFIPYNEHLSHSRYYTSDFDLSNYSANQWGLGLGYVDIFTRLNVLGFGFKSVDLKFYHYSRNSPFSSDILTLGISFIQS
jgi:hypothetical protein